MYKVSDDVLNHSAPAFRCSRCKHIFELEAHGSPDASSDADLIREAVPGGYALDKELSLPFDPAPDILARDVDAGKTAELPREEFETSADRLDLGDQWSLSEPAAKEEHPFVMPKSDRMMASSKILDAPRDFPVEDPFFPNTESSEDTDDTNNILPISSYRDQKASILPFVTLSSLLVIGFMLISLISYAKPQASEGIIKRIPLIGTAVLKNDYLKDGILIQSLRSGYQTIQGNREVLLVSGVALNQNPLVVREIQLSGVAYNNDGKEIEKQTIWVGNTISPKIIRGMTLEDIPHLQNLKPLKSFEVPPGDSIPFTIVFLKSAKTAREFSCTVLMADGAI
jgi:hypothetical protein